MELTREQKVLKAFVDTVQATGGLIEYDDGTLAPVGEPDWIDLGEAAMDAWEVLRVAGVDVQPLVIEKRESN